MNATSTKKGAAGKFLALLASLTMIVAGLVGVAIAAPASAVAVVPVVASGYDINAYPGLNVCPQNTDGWSSHQSAGDAKTTTVYALPGKLISEICVKAGAEQQGDGPAKVIFAGPAEAVTFSHPSGKEISHYSYKTVDKPPVLAVSAVGVANCVVTGQEYSVVWTVTNGSTATAMIAPKSFVGTPVSVAAAGTTTFTQLVTGPGPFKAVFTATIGEGVVDSADATATAGTSCIIPDPCANGACDKPKDPTPPVVVTEEPPAPVVENVAVEAPVALPATVVPAPAKKPVVVSAPKPAKVAGGVANTVSVPEAATVPAAVPAGDGSQAPGLPMWALALVVVGALGAAAAGKQIIGARN